MLHPFFPKQETFSHPHFSLPLSGLNGLRKEKKKKSGGGTDTLVAKNELTERQFIWRLFMFSDTVRNRPIFLPQFHSARQKQQVLRRIMHTV